MSLDRLMTKLADGDKSAFGEIYANTRKAVYYTALSVLRERSLAEDAMQSAYLKVLKNAAQYKAGSNAAAWIASIARNEALNLLKQRQKTAYVDEQENLNLFGTAQTDDYGLLIDLARRILPEEEFAILMLITAGGYKRREIAGLYGMPVATVTWKYNEALKKMRAALDERIGD